ncbi:MAG: 2Fe-2S iron-sulfur cluster-binding protein [Alphaproteobacteria bacterium]|nr:2Fe-2S iron-sulfur cluster-binding protein [Alphaproteobacteria bacterium]
MDVTVTIRQWPTPVAVQPGQTVLEAALAQGAPYPHGCRSGNCGACKSRLLAGDVEMTPYSEYALTEEERTQGLVLACRAVPCSDAELAWLEPDEVVVHPLRDLTCRVAAVDVMTHDIKRVRLAVESGGPFTFAAGQYAALGFGDLPLRDYSMANAPDPAGTGELEFHIRHVAGGASSAYVAKVLRPGEPVRVQGPYGSSFLREQHSGPILAIAGGSGLAPIKSIVETALTLGMRQPIHLYFGVRDERDLYLDSHFRDLAARHPNLAFVPVLSEPRAATARRTGFVHEAAARDFTDFDGAKAYVAGPPVMVEAASTLLADRGMRREDIHADAFYTEAERAAVGAR